MTTDTHGSKFSKAEIEAIRRAAKDEAGVLAEFWAKIRSLGRRIPFAEDVVAAAMCATDPATPSRVKLIVLGALAYFVMPFDGIPDILPLVGFTDDAAVIAATIAAIRAHMTEEHWRKARAFLGRN
jgi:uncharacterized membrane protein YkvA (DUF1232 family)